MDQTVKAVPIVSFAVCLRCRRKSPPIKARPSIIIAQLAGSGTALTTGGITPATGGEPPPPGNDPPTSGSDPPVPPPPGAPPALPPPLPPSGKDDRGPPGGVEVMPGVPGVPLPGTLPLSSGWGIAPKAVGGTSRPPTGPRKPPPGPRPPSPGTSIAYATGAMAASSASSASGLNRARSLITAPLDRVSAPTTPTTIQRRHRSSVRRVTICSATTIILYRL